MADGRPAIGTKGMGHVQIYVLRDLVVEGEWREKDNLPGTPRARAIMMQLQRRGLARLAGGDHISGDSVYRPTKAADEWFVEQGYLFGKYSRSPFVYLKTDKYIP